MTLALSTAYGAKNASSWQALLESTQRAGFKAVELNVEIPDSWLSEIEKSVTRGEVSVLSVHNYCPKIQELPKGRTIYSGYLLTSDDAQERYNAITYTKKSIETAKHVGAKFVVVHCGEVPSSPDGHELLKKFTLFGANREYLKDLEDLRIRRAANAGKYLERLYSSLDELANFAAKNGIALGLENRFYTHEIPSTQELCDIFDKFVGAPLYYWHDNGHAEVFSRMLWSKNHIEIIAPLAKHIGGFHLHDLRKIVDHYAPGSGDFDFKCLLPYIKKEHCLVVEAHSKSTFDELSNSIKYLNSISIA